MRYFDLHCDTITECFDKGCGLKSNDLHISLERADYLDTYVQVFAVWTPDKIRGKAAWERFLKVTGLYAEETRKNGIVTCEDGAALCDIVNNQQCAQRRAAVLSIEGSAALNGEINNLYEAWRRGVRLITLTWNGACEAGGGCLDGGGLTALGKDLVKEMERLHIVPDVSHLSDAGFCDMISLYGGTFVATHSNSRAVCDNPRNLTDAQFCEIVSRKGLVGLNLYPPFMGGEKPEFILRHVDRFLSLGGQRALAIGADFDGARMPCGINGIHDMSLIYELLYKEYGEDICSAVFFDNAYEFFKTALTGTENSNNIL